MRVTILTVGLLVAAGVAIVGFSVINLPSIDQVCSGAVVDADLCTSARLRGAIFASALTASAMISAAVLLASYLLASARGHRADRSAASEVQVETSPGGASVER